MTQSDDHTLAYRTVVLPGLGRVEVPEGVSDAEVLAQVLGADASAEPATPEKKTKKKP